MSARILVLLLLVGSLGCSVYRSEVERCLDICEKLGGLERIDSGGGCACRVGYVQ